MEPEEVKKKRTRGRKRKTSPRYTRYRGRQKKPGVATALKALWADPEWRARMMATRAESDKRRKGNGRLGVPDGMRKQEAYPLLEAAKESARHTMTELKQAGVLDGVDPRSEEALETAIKVMRSPGDKKVTLAAARLVLDFTRSKPASKAEVTVNKAEEWLAAVAVKNESDEGGSSTDA